MTKSLVPLFSFLIKVRANKLTLAILKATLKSRPLQMLSRPLELSDSLRHRCHHQDFYLQACIAWCPPRKLE